MGEAEAEAAAQAELSGYGTMFDPKKFGVTLLAFLQYKSRDSCIELLKKVPSEETLYKNILHYMLAEDYPNCIRAIIEALSYYDPAHPPLHNAACCGAHSLAQLFLDYGQDPNVRAHYTSSLRLLLPLEVALQKYREDFKWDGCIFKLICKMCALTMRNYLETARVLALQTKGLDQEIVKYVKEGKVEHLCVLMLLGYHSRIPSVECFEGDESTKGQMLQLVEIFQRIGDKLQVYVRLPREPCKLSRLGRVVLDIASIYRDAGLPVKSIDTIMYSGRNRYVGEDNRSMREASRAPLFTNLHGLQHLNGNYMTHNVTWGSRSLHTKVHEAGSSHSNSPLKGSSYVVFKLFPFWKKSSLWMMPLTRAVTHV